MKKKGIWILLTLLVISLSIFVFGMIYQNELPKLVEEINNSTIGGILTAVITVLLLQGQTATEEEKERNATVFEKKSELFTEFIDELWKIWEDRSVSLEELSRLMKLVAQKIIPYAETKNSEQILGSLEEIAKKATPNQSDRFNPKVRETIQKEIFNIINVLSTEINLGGKITVEMQKKLNSLEENIVPYLNKKGYFERLEETLSEKTKGYLHSFREESNCLWWEVGQDTGVWLRVGAWGKAGEIYIAYWSHYESNKQYNKYRYAVRGADKDFLKYYNKCSWDIEQFNKLLNGEDILPDEIKKLSEEIVRFYENMNEKGELREDTPSINDIIEECNKVT